MYPYAETNIRVLYGKMVFENKKDKISSQEKVFIKVVRNIGNGNADILINSNAVIHNDDIWLNKI